MLRKAGLLPFKPYFLLSAGVLLCACDPGPLQADDGPGTGGSGGGGQLGPILPSPSPRVVRLSHVQWENTVRDLLQLDAPSGLSSSFPVQAHSAGYMFDNPADALQVDQALSGAYANAASSLAQLATSSSERLARIVPPGSDEATRGRAFVESFGERAFRRPLSEEEIGAYLELLDAGRSAYDDITGFDAGVRLVIEGMLQSPNFLYRTESSTELEGDFVALSSWEIAQRLSYFITNSMPDDELLAAARAGELVERAQVRAHAERLLDTPAARDAISRFHEQLLHLETYGAIAPAAAVYPDASPELGASALASARKFLDDLVFDQRQGFAGLVSTTRAFANSDLAQVYGLEGDFGAELVPVELPADERRGLFTQVGFLAANSTSINPDPIHRGVFLAKRILCRSISAPPDNVTPLPPSGEGTNRDVVERHTESQAGCRSCHERHINPYGFVFENYDAVGAFRTIDNDLPVDASASPVLDGEERPVSGAVEFAEALAGSREAHECYARHLLEYAHGRNGTTMDLPMISLLGEASRSDAGATLDLILTLVESDSFLRRSPEELP